MPADNLLKHKGHEGQLIGHKGLVTLAVVLAILFQALRPIALHAQKLEVKDPYLRIHAAATDPLLHHLRGVHGQVQDVWRQGL